MSLNEIAKSFLETNPDISRRAFLKNMNGIYTKTMRKKRQIVFVEEEIKKLNKFSQITYNTIAVISIVIYNIIAVISTVIYNIIADVIERRRIYNERLAAANELSRFLIQKQSYKKIEKLKEEIKEDLEQKRLLQERKDKAFELMMKNSREEIKAYMDRYKANREKTEKKKIQEENNDKGIKTVMKKYIKPKRVSLIL